MFLPMTLGVVLQGKLEPAGGTRPGPTLSTGEEPVAEDDSGSVVGAGDGADSVSSEALGSSVPHTKLPIILVGDLQDFIMVTENGVYRVPLDEKYMVCFLQETHTALGDEAIWLLEWQGEVYMSLTRKSSGVATLLVRHFQREILGVKEPVPSHLLHLIMWLGCVVLHFVNIYTLWAETKCFYGEVSARLASINETQYVVLGGHFNRILKDRDHDSVQSASMWQVPCMDYDLLWVELLLFGARLRSVYWHFNNLLQEEEQFRALFHQFCDRLEKKAGGFTSLSLWDIMVCNYVQVLGECLLAGELPFSWRSDPADLGRMRVPGGVLGSIFCQVALKMLPVFYQYLITVWDVVDSLRAYPPLGVAAIIQESAPPQLQVQEIEQGKGCGRG
eukprot:g43030.t1